jgi:hypothetical protein
MSLYCYLIQKPVGYSTLKSPSIRSYFTFVNYHSYQSCMSLHWCEPPHILYVTALVWVTIYPVCHCTGVSHHILYVTALVWVTTYPYATVLVWVTTYPVCHCTGVSHHISFMSLYWCESPHILYVTVRCVTTYPVCHCTGVSHHISCMPLYWCVTTYPVCHCTGVSHHISCISLYWCESPHILYVTALVWVTTYPVTALVWVTTYPVCHCTGVSHHISRMSLYWCESPDILYVSVLLWVTIHILCDGPCVTHHLFCALQYWFAVTAWRVRTLLSQCTGRYHFQPLSVTRGTTSRVETATQTHKSLWGPTHSSGISPFPFFFTLILCKNKKVKLSL